MFLVNVNIVRNFDLGGRRLLQVRMDVQNLFDRAVGESQPRSDQHELRQDHDGHQQHHAVLHIRDEIQFLGESGRPYSHTVLVSPPSRVPYGEPRHSEYIPTFARTPDAAH